MISVEPLAGPPAEHRLGVRRVGVRRRRVAGPPGDDLVGHRRAGDDLGRRPDDVEDRRADAGAEVDGQRVLAVRQAAGERVDGLDVGVGEVLDVDVVADAGAVGRRVVVAEHLDRRTGAEHGLHDERDRG